MLLPLVALLHLSVGSNSSQKSSEEVLSELLVLPQPPSTCSGQPRKKAINDKAQEITDDNVLQELKDKKDGSQKEEGRK